MIHILWEDSGLLIVCKPSGTICERDESKSTSLPCLLEQELVRRGDKPVTLYPIYRLDKEVSGVLVLAKHEKMAGLLSALVAERRMNKTYLALAEGTVEPIADTLQDLLYHDAKRNKTYVVKRERRGVKPASLSYERLAVKDGCSVLRIELHTGRTHQIRVQLASRQHPVCGDRRYGSSRKGDLSLLCHRVAFAHPVTGEQVDVSVWPVFWETEADDSACGD